VEPHVLPNPAPGRADTGHPAPNLAVLSGLILALKSVPQYQLTRPHSTPPMSMEVVGVRTRGADGVQVLFVWRLHAGHMSQRLKKACQDFKPSVLWDLRASRPSWGA
jgi:hypothetical protein